MNGTTIQTAPSSLYVMGRTSAEYQRLRRQAQIWEPATAALLDRIGLARGMACLDVGSGPGEVMRLMGQRVGANGRVVGVDLDRKLGHEALNVLRATQLSQFDFVEGDLQTLTNIPGSPFDVVYARLLLIHTPDPCAMLQTMLRWVKPGGYLVVQDYDLCSLDAYPVCAPLEEFKRVCYSVFQHAGRDIQMGRKLPWYFREAGLGAADGTDVAGILASMDQSWEMVATTYQSVLPLALKLGITTQAQSEEFFQQIKAAPQQCHAVLWPLLVGAWKQKVN